MVETTGDGASEHSAESLDSDPYCNALLDYLKSNRGFDFTGYKRTSLMRRLRKRMHAISIGTCAEYLDYVQVRPDEFEHLFNTILINVSSFFRDPTTWDVVRETIIPDILATKGADAGLRIWSAGCAGGQEAYTVAMLLAESCGLDFVRDRVKIYATDADEVSLQQARLACYTKREIACIPEYLAAKYIKPAGLDFVVSSDLRRAAIFGRHNLVVDAPISHIDLLVCRNTLMYFNAEVQTRVLSRFHFALNPAGYLLLGRAEMLFSHPNLFQPLNLKHRIFRRVQRTAPHNGIERPTPDVMSGAQETSLLASPGPWKAAFAVTPHAQILVDRSGTVVLCNNRAIAEFRLSDTDAGRPLRDLEISYRPVDLRTLIDRAYQERQTVEAKEMPYSSLRGGVPEAGYVDVQVAPIVDPVYGLLGALVTFIDVTRFRQLQAEIEETNRELETAYEELQSTNEELETTNEELHSANEELETTNEELQSTNQELETMNEELQSANEELTAINDELRQRTHDLNSANSFMTAVLSSLRAAALVLDRELQVQVWNRAAEDLWGLRAEEAIGANFVTLDIGLPIEQLTGLIRSALNGDKTFSQVGATTINRRGRSVDCRVQVSRLAGRDQEGRGILLVIESLDTAPSGVDGIETPNRV